ncbi:AsmA family protein [Mangrovicella endophytica]|uniref:AsmA family protein n=1 Tax=Mangrovicella endophytica TaxID=2066697 RepID=UPI000C9DEC77|nr:AsmA family protein [Mangrovicella endophytica]
MTERRIPERPEGRSTVRGTLAYLRRRPFAATGLLLLLLGAVAGVIAYASLSLRQDDARILLVDRLERLTAQPVSIDGPVTVELFPSSRLTASGIRIGSDRSKPVLTIDGIVAELDLVDAVFGTAEIDALTLRRPQLKVLPSPDGSTQAGTTETGVDRLEAVTASLRDLLPRLGELTDLTIVDGVLRTPRPDAAPLITQADLSLKRLTEGGAARIEGSYIWRGDQTRLSVDVGAPSAFFEGGRSSVDVSLAAPHLTLSFEGTGSFQTSLALTGSFSLSTPSLKNAVAWLGDERTAVPDFGAVSLGGMLDASRTGFNLSDATVTLADSTGRGAIELLSGSARTIINGTLDFDTLDLTPLGHAVAPLPRDLLDLQRPIATAFIRDYDVDLRLSATTATIGDVAMNDVAATAMFNDGVATLDLGDASLYGGEARIHLTVDARDGRPRAQASIRLSGIDMGQLLPAVGVEAIGVSGQSDLTTTFDSTVTSWADILRRGRSNTTLSIRSGRVDGVDSRLFAAPRNQTPFQLVAAGNRTPFSRIDAQIDTFGTRLQLGSLTIDSADALLSARGDFAADRGTIDMAGELRATAQAGSPFATGAPDKQFRIHGTWPDPTVTETGDDKPI